MSITPDAAILVTIADMQQAIQALREENTSLMRQNEDHRTSQSQLLEQIAGLRGENAQLLSMIPPEVEPEGPSEEESRSGTHTAGPLG